MPSINITECLHKMEEYGTPILLAEVGSTAHGTSVGYDDLDLLGIVVPSKADTIGLTPFDHHIYRTAEVRTGKHDAKSEAGDVDLTIYSLQKYVGLAKKGNPSILNVLYGPLHFENAVGHRLRHEASLFISKEAGERFKGYMRAQRHRLAGERGQKGVNRPDLVEKYGYDTKYAYHIIRLGLQGLEYMKRGKISVPLNEVHAELCLNIRNGQYTQEKVLEWADELEAGLTTAIAQSTWPDTAPARPIDSLLVDLYDEVWGLQDAGRTDLLHSVQFLGVAKGD